MTISMWAQDRLYLAVLYGDAPTDEEWDRWVTMSVERSGRDQRVIVESHNSGPNAKQRKELADAVRDVELRVAVLTDSAVVRGIVTALAWLGVPQRAFPIGGYWQAANYLELVPAELDRALEELPRLRAEAGFHVLKKASSG
ncbi:MAG TPA: hypothetical protein VFG30_03030 [Polyangiales bacterium]|nr:hypothetical protein [Polyangiales bacterium]